jgi:hypothetical protein
MLNGEVITDLLAGKRDRESEIEINVGGGVMAGF